MSAMTDFLAVDLGAETGRVISGRFGDSRIAMEEVHRFPNRPVRLPDGLHWDVLRIFDEVKAGFAKAVRSGVEPASIGVDSWGVDFALLDWDGALVSNPYHYRDPRTGGMVELATRRVPAEEIYWTTGIQFMQINTLCQLLAMESSPLLEAADTLLLIPDLINYWLTGEQVCEFTNATTTQLLNVESGDWARGLAERLGIPTGILPEVVPPATDLGPLLPGVARELGVEESVSVTAVASHDTASAVVAVPASGEDFVYISSGTWSLVGVEAPRPVATREAMEANFTNEGGFDGRTRFLKNVMGLWLLQECRRTWSRDGRDYPYEELGDLAASAPGSGPLVDPDHPAFLAPGDMPSRIRNFCEATGQKPPEEPGEFARCVFESLALKYRWVLEQAEEIAGRRVEKVHVVGGGSRSDLLCQLTADATGLPVVAGPVEATALGNLMVQACARGHVGSLEGIREAVSRSVDARTYEPGNDGDREELRERFEGILDAATTLDSPEGEQSFAG